MRSLELISCLTFCLFFTAQASLTVVNLGDKPHLKLTNMTSYEENIHLDDEYSFYKILFRYKIQASQWQKDETFSFRVNGIKVFEYIHKYSTMIYKEMLINNVTYYEGEIAETRNVDSSRVANVTIQFATSVDHKDLYFEVVKIEGQNVPEGIVAFLVSMVIITVLTCCVAGIVIMVKRSNKKKNKYQTSNSLRYEVSDDKVNSSQRSNDMSDSRD